MKSGEYGLKCLSLSIEIFQLSSFQSVNNKKAVLPQGNRAMPQLFFSV